MRKTGHAAKAEAGILASRRRTEELGRAGSALSLSLVLVLAVALVTALGVAVLYLARGTPALASLLKAVPAQTTVIYDSAGKPIAELHGAVNRVIVPSSRLPLSLKRRRWPSRTSASTRTSTASICRE